MAVCEQNPNSRENIAAAVPKLVVKFVPREEGREEHAKSLHLGCQAALSRLEKSRVPEGLEQLPAGEARLVRGFLLGRPCVHCATVSDLAATSCSACSKELL